MTIYEQISLIPISSICDKLGIKVSGSKNIICFKGHDKNTPSLSIDLKKNLWNCFGACGIGGSNIELVMSYHNLDKKMAIQWFIQNYSIENKSFTSIRRIKKLKPAILKKEPLKFELKPDIEILTDICSVLTLREAGKKYLHSRNINDNSINYFKPVELQNPDSLFKYLSKRYNKERLLKTGVFKIKENIVKLNWWSKVILFPFFNLQNEIFYLQARNLDSNAEPKWINLSKIDTQIYNLPVLNTLTEDDNVYICEGIIDTINFTQLGYKSIGILGANSFNEDWIYLIKDFNIFVVPDNDKAGEILFKTIDKALMKYGKKANKITFDKGKDVSEFISQS